MDFNYLAVLVAAASTFVVGSIWYHPKVLGTIWMREEGLTQEDLQKGNMAKIFGLTFVFALMISFVMQTLVIHQVGAYNLVGGVSATNVKPSYAAFMADYGNAYRTFHHGALHGLVVALFLIFPVLATNGLFSRKSWTLILIKSGYWLITLALVGGIIGGWSKEGFAF